MTMIPYLQVRQGMVLVEEDQLQIVVERDADTRSDWRTSLHLKLRSLKTGKIILRRVQPDELAEEALLEKRVMEYIYQDGDGYVFMDPESCEQMTLAPAWVRAQRMNLEEGCAAELTLYEGQPIGLELSAPVEQ